MQAMTLKPSHLLFFAVAALEMGSSIFGWNSVHLWVKPLIMITLITLYLKEGGAVNKTFVAALFFCWTGDVILLFDEFNLQFFVTGLGSFLVAHLLFIFSYRHFRLAGISMVGTQRVRLSFPIVLAGSGLLMVLYPRLGDLKIPVTVYALVLTLMVLQSIFRFGRTSTQSFWLVFSGAVLFMISDSLLAINKFYQPIRYADFWVMTTYLAAVYLIVVGVIAHQRGLAGTKK